MGRSSAGASAPADDSSGRLVAKILEKSPSARASPNRQPSRKESGDCGGTLLPPAAVQRVDSANMGIFEAEVEGSPKKTITLSEELGNGAGNKAEAPLLDKVLEGLWTPNSPWECTPGPPGEMQSPTHAQAYAQAWEYQQAWMMQNMHAMGMSGMYPGMPPGAMGMYPTVSGKGAPRKNSKKDRTASEVASAAKATTAMLKNIPNRYTRPMLVERLNDGFHAKFDFLYLPIDFSNKCNMGYAFINFRDPETCQRFTETFHNIESKVCLPGCNSSKICEVSLARVQGQQENIANLLTSPVMDELGDHEDWQPLLFDADGGQLAFPKSDTKVDKKTRRIRTASEVADKVAFRKSSAGSMSECSPMMSAAGAASPTFTPTNRPATSPTFAPKADPLVPEEPGSKTTVMLRNLPNKYTRDKLSQSLTEQFPGKFDFIYLPMDFEHCCNMGYAFINFRDTASCAAFVEAFDGKKSCEVLPGFRSTKVCTVAYARVQGQEANLKNLQTITMMQQLAAHPDWHPLILDAEGKEVPFMKPIKGQQEPRAGRKQSGHVDYAAAYMQSQQAGYMQAQQGMVVLRQQVEYYFSADNLCRDSFLRTHMDKDGFVPLALLAAFPKVRSLLFGAGGPQALAVISVALHGSSSVQMDGACVRVRSSSEELRKGWPMLSAAPEKSRSKE